MLQHPPSNGGDSDASPTRNPDPAIAFFILGCFVLTGGLVVGRADNSFVAILAFIVLTQLGLVQIHKFSRGERIAIIGFLFIAVIVIGPYFTNLVRQNMRDLQAHRAEGIVFHTNLSAINSACRIWSKGHGDAYPPDLGTLADGQIVSYDLLVGRPGTGNKLPDDFDSWTLHEKADWINRNTAYAYVPGLTDTGDGNKIVAFEKLSTPNKQNIVVLRNDHRCYYLLLDDARRIIFEQTGRTLEDWSKDP